MSRKRLYSHKENKSKRKKENKKNKKENIRVIYLIIGQTLLETKSKVIYNNVNRNINLRA